MLVLMPAMEATESSDDVEYEFSKTQSGYVFFGSFKTRVRPECALEIAFEYDHVRALAMDAREVKLVDQGSSWNQISYTYQRFIYFENKSSWHRALNISEQRVDFTLLSSQNNRATMPQIISSKGFYQIRENGQFITVEYYQQCEFTESSVTKIYLNRVKKEAIRFMHEFSDYTNTYCQQREPDS